MNTPDTDAYKEIYTLQNQMNAIITELHTRKLINTDTALELLHLGTAYQGKDKKEGDTDVNK